MGADIAYFFDLDHDGSVHFGVLGLVHATVESCGRRGRHGRGFRGLIRGRWGVCV